MGSPVKIYYKNALTTVQGDNINGTTTVPLRFFAETLGHRVTWRPPNEVWIDGDPPAAAPPAPSYRKLRYRNTDLHMVTVKMPVLKVVQAEPGKLLDVSGTARQNKAQIAVNGGFFWKRSDNTYWPVTPVITDHQSVGKAGPLPVARAVLGQNDDGTMEIRTAIRPEELTGYKYALGAGPVLVVKGKVSTGKEQFLPDIMVGKSPRTAAGLIDPKTLVLVVAEGRSKTDAGLTLTDLAAFMVGIGCKEAMNFDGGRSCTFWLDGKAIVKGGQVVNALLVL